MPILLIDDEPDVRESLKSLLETSGYEVITAESGTEALKYLNNGISESISLMLVDFSMTDMNGEEFLRIAWSVKQWPPALVITTEVAPWRTLDLIELGVGYVRKPFNTNLLLGTIEMYLRKEARNGRTITGGVDHIAVDGRPVGLKPQG
jgi:two-component system response regulator MprA